jgi:hypothetical protein
VVSVIEYEKIKGKPNIFKSFTGLSVEGFDALKKDFAVAYAATVERREGQRTSQRQRRAGGGRKGAVPSIEAKLVFILFYFKYYPVQVVQGYFFGMGQAQANEWIHTLTPVLNQALGYERQLPARQAQTIEQVLAACPSLEFILDGTERPIRRPKDRTRQEQHYSGKKKRHTVKNNAITDKRTGKIKALSPTVPGKKHDKKLADEQGLRFPKGSRLYQDTGFQGYTPKNAKIYQPTKKPKGRELTPAQKARNTRISKARIGIEHGFADVKVFHIIADVFRNFRAGFDDLVMETACGLHNLRLDFPLSA